MAGFYCCVQVPYGTSFHQNVQWACRYEGRGKCRLRVTGEVEFTKSPFVKGMIQKASEEVRLTGLLYQLLYSCWVPPLDPQQSPPHPPPSPHLSSIVDETAFWMTLGHGLHAPCALMLWRMCWSGCTCALQYVLVLCSECSCCALSA